MVYKGSRCELGLPHSIPLVPIQKPGLPGAVDIADLS